MQKRWEIKSDVIPTNIKQAIQILLSNRKIDSLEEFITNVSPDEYINKYPPFTELKNNFVEAKELIQSTIKNNRPIIIHGDYDADGQTASAILYRTIKYDLGYKNTFVYIPNRFDEGYGLSEESLNGMKELISTNGYEVNDALVITVDCGIVSHKEVNTAKTMGFKIIVSDHHQPSEILPKPNVLLWTDKSTGAGIAWILSFYLLGEIKYSELATIGTICDLQPLIGFNRSIAKYGLNQINHSDIPGLKALKEVAEVKGDIEEYHIGWVIGPRLNATGRLENGIDSVNLLITNDETESKQIAIKLNDLNLTRQEKTKADLETAITKYAGVAELPPILLTYSETFHEGVIGLVAGKLVQTYYRPSIALTLEKDNLTAKGSARSIEGISIIETLRKFSELFDKLGGHDMAAGFSIKLEKVDQLRESLEKADYGDPENFVPKVKIECDLPASLFDLDLFYEIQKMRPFGVGNPEPVFVMRNMKIFNLNFLGKENNHLKLFLNSQTGDSITAMYFSATDNDIVRDLSIGEQVDVAFTLSLNEWNGRKSLEMKVKDLRKS